jgi:16S rRNA (cytosine1402-N4)-methyltransferase
MPESSIAHISVLASDSQNISVFTYLSPQSGETVLDVTLGLGGHGFKFLEAIGPTGTYTGLDADAENLKRAAGRLSRFSDRTRLIHGNFRDVAELAPGPFDIVFADLGLSSPHLDDPSRGFSFRGNAPLDMRFDTSSGVFAEQMLRKMKDEEIAQILYRYAEIPRVRSLVMAITESLNATADVWTTDALKACVEKVFTYKSPGILPQVFQAIRIAVNDEMGALESLLTAVPSLLKHGGRCGIISYHSLEDRMVKQTFRTLTMAEKDETTGADKAPAPFTLLTKKAVVPSAEEQKENPRSRSAKFRAIKRQ